MEGQRFTSRIYLVEEIGLNSVRVFLADDLVEIPGTPFSLDRFHAWNTAFLEKMRPLVVSVETKPTGKQYFEQRALDNITVEDWSVADLSLYDDDDI